MNLLRFLILISLLSMPAFTALAIADEKAEGDKPSFLLEMKATDDKENYPGVSRIVISLLLVTAIAFFVVFSLKKIGYGNNKLFSDSTLIQVLASKKLSVKSIIHLVDIEGIQYVVVEKDSAISIVLHLPDNSSDQKL